MPENTTNTMPCCVTDIGTARIWWKWRQGHWIITAKPDSAPAQKRHKADRHGKLSSPSRTSTKRGSAELARSELGWFYGPFCAGGFVMTQAAE